MSVSSFASVVHLRHAELDELNCRCGTSVCLKIVATGDRRDIFSESGVE